jgi:hypothetical protein
MHSMHPGSSLQKIKTDPTYSYDTKDCGSIKKVVFCLKRLGKNHYFTQVTQHFLLSMTTSVLGSLRYVHAFMLSG